MRRGYLNKGRGQAWGGGAFQEEGRVLKRSSRGEHRIWWRGNALRLVRKAGTRKYSAPQAVQQIWEFFLTIMESYERGLTWDWHDLIYFLKDRFGCRLVIIIGDRIWGEWVLAFFHLCQCATQYKLALSFVPLKSMSLFRHSGSWTSSQREVRRVLHKILNLLNEN